jgi:hypothetical protein
VRSEVMSRAQQANVDATRGAIVPLRRTIVMKAEKKK